MTSEAKGSEVAFTLAMAVASSVVATALAHLTGGFAELFAGFGTDLPFLTAAYINLAPFAPFVSIVFWIPRVAALVRGKAGVPRALIRFAAAGPIFFFVLLLFSWVAYYLPIWKLGSVV